MTEMVSNSSSQYLNKYVNTLNQNKTNLNRKNGLFDLSNNKVDNMKRSSSSSIIGNKTIIAKSGQAGYFKEMDLDEDGSISLEEFNEYCENNGIDAKEKLVLLSAMSAANTSLKIAKETTKQKESENKSISQEDNVVYAKEGDEKYNEAMDENTNGVVTYAEYLKYTNGEDKSNEIEDSENISIEEKPSSQDKQDKISETYSEKT